MPDHSLPPREETDCPPFPPIRLLLLPPERGVLPPGRGLLPLEGGLPALERGLLLLDRLLPPLREEGDDDDLLPLLLREGLEPPRDGLLDDALRDEEPRDAEPRDDDPPDDRRDEP